MIFCYKYTASKNSELEKTKEDLTRALENEVKAKQERTSALLREQSALRDVKSYRKQLKELIGELEKVREERDRVLLVILSFSYFRIGAKLGRNFMPGAVLQFSVCKTLNMTIEKRMNETSTEP